MKLNNHNLARLNADIVTPGYDRSQLRQGIVHFGVGGFHRAHQAVYADRLLQEGGSLDWGICGIGVREADSAMQQVLQGQDYLYSVMSLGQDAQPSVQVIDAISDFLFAPDCPERVIEKLACPQTRIVSLTITEGGYLLDDHSGEFDLAHPDIRHDLENPESPRTVFGYLGAALERRRDRALPAFTLLSCDNLPHNGDKARKALLSFVKHQRPALYDWIEARVSFPNSMVDRITPVTTDAHRQQLREVAGIDDAWPVVCEPFSQWVLEDDFCNGRPAWEKVGVQFTADVSRYETMKMRLLNASHSAMAYAGVLAGYRYSHEVVSDPRFAGFIRLFMDLDVTPTLGVIEGIDLEQYKSELMARFSNPRIADQLERLCKDGSSKIPKFILPTLHERLASGGDVERFALILASWALYLHNAVDTGIDDPAAESLVQACRQRDGLTSRFLGLEDVFGTSLQHNPDFADAFEQALVRLETQGVAAFFDRVQAA